MPRPYYSRPNRDDKDYFDFDLNHSVDMYEFIHNQIICILYDLNQLSSTRRQISADTVIYFKQFQKNMHFFRPQHWETKLLNEYKAKGEAPLSGYLFTKGPSDYRATGTSYLSAALR
jgi:hypothetical protein